MYTFIISFPKSLTMKLTVLREILSKLVEGDVEKIAAQTDRTKTAVYQTFRKQTFIAKVIIAALDRIEQTALDNLKFVTKKRAELQSSIAEYEAKKRAQLEKRLDKQQQQQQQAA